MEEAFQILLSIIPPGFVICMSRSLITNISYAHKNLCTFSLYDEVKVAIFRPRPYGYPTIKGMQYFTPEEREKFLKEKNFLNFQVKENSLFAEDKLAELEQFVQLFFSKYTEETFEEKGKKVNRDCKFVLVLKTQCYMLSESLFLHVVMSRSKKLLYKLDEELEPKSKSLSVEFKDQ